VAKEPIDIKSIFCDVIEKRTAKERAAYLDKVCGNDADLRAKIEELLKLHDNAGDFLESPVLNPDVTLNDSPMTESPGTVVGNYRLLEKIGEGGMAVVYMAEQKRPIQRQVALKIIKLGMDTKQVIARFEVERQALALMDHPNIAKVLDAGKTETGRPYFVMELVKGVSITDYCDKNKLSTDERLDLFIKVCSAVQHAHQKGIIHRDIKPTNMMVTLHDGKPVPKVIDFGIAKATSQRLTEKTLFTRYAQAIGTPAYMSPEQAEMSGLDVDTRTDIYSLGVLLYELLTGVTPFSEEQLRKAGYLEMQRIIREEEPVKPSTKLSSLGATLTDVAEHRKASPDLLTKLVRGDLDWIVMKSLEKDRSRRYETANEFAMDIKRHLSNKPVIAGPPSVRYRFGKFIRRKRALVIAVAAVLMVIIAGIVVSTIFAIGQFRARADAERKGKISQAVTELLTEDILAGVIRVHDSSGDVTMSSALDNVARGLEDRFEDEPLMEASICEALGKTYHRLNEYKRAEPQLKRAQQIRLEQLGENTPETLQSTSHLALLYLDQKRYDEAQSLLVRVLECKQSIFGEEHSDTLASMRDLALVYYYQDQYNKAKPLLVKALEIGRRVLGKDDLKNQISMGWLAKVYCGQNLYEQAEPLYVEMLEIRRRLLGQDYEKEMVTSLVMKELIKLYENWGKPQQAKEYKIKLRQLSSNLILHDGDLDNWLQVVNAWYTEPKHEEAAKKLPPVVDHMGKTAEWYYMEGRYKEAEPLYLEKLEIQRRILGEKDPDVLSSMRDLALLYYHQGQYNKVELLLTKGLEISRSVLGEDDSSTLECMMGLAFLRATCPIAEFRDGEKALELATKACELTNWKDSDYIFILAAAYAEVGDFDSAVKWQQKAIDLLTEEATVQLRADLEERLKLYESGKPYREGS